MSLATVAAVVGIGAGGLGIYNQLKGNKNAGANTGGLGGIGGPPVYVPTGQGTADQQWQQLMTQLFGAASGTAGMLGPDLNAAYQTLRGIPTSEVERTGKEAGQYYQGLASSADNVHNQLMNNAGDDLTSKRNLQGQGSDYMSQMLALGMPLFGQGQNFMQSMMPLANEMAQGGRGFNAQMQALMPEVFGAGRTFNQQQQGPASELQAAGRQLWNTASDPEGKLAASLQQQVTDASRAGTSARGIGMSGNAAGIENKDVSDFLMNWQDRQLGRQATGLQGMEGAFGEAGQLQNTGLQGLLASYGLGSNMGAAGTQALNAGLMGSGNLQNLGLQGMLGMYGQGGNMLQSGMQGLQNMYGLAGNYGQLSNQEQQSGLQTGENAAQYLQQSSMVPYLSQMFGPQMAMQFANMLGQGMQGDVYGPLSGAQGGYSPYLNFGQGATGNAFNQGQANLGNLYSGLMGQGGQGAFGGNSSIMNMLMSMFGGGGPFSSGGGGGGSGFTDYGGSSGYGGDYYGSGGMGTP